MVEWRSCIHYSTDFKYQQLEVNDQVPAQHTQNSTKNVHHCSIAFNERYDKSIWQMKLSTEVVDVQSALFSRQQVARNMGRRPSTNPT